MRLTHPRGFARLDFDEIRRVAGLTGCDIALHARRKRCCGPGCDYLVQDKRYCALVLLGHIEQMLRERPSEVPRQALDWLAEARTAAREYAAIERALRPPMRKGS